MGTWVDLSKELPGGSNSPARTTPVPFGGESDYMRMLREAQVLDLSGSPPHFQEQVGWGPRLGSTPQGNDEEDRDLSPHCSHGETVRSNV